MKIAGVNGRVFTRDVLDDAIKAGKDNSEPIKLLVIDEDYYKTVHRRLPRRRALSASGTRREQTGLPR